MTWFKERPAQQAMPSQNFLLNREETEITSYMEYMWVSKTI